MYFSKTNKTKSLISYILGSVALSLFLTVAFVRGSLVDGPSFLKGFSWAFSISITQWIGLEIIYGMIDRRVSWMKTPAKKVYIQVLTFLT